MVRGFIGSVDFVGAGGSLFPPIFFASLTCLLSILRSCGRLIIVIFPLILLLSPTHPLRLLRVFRVFISGTGAQLHLRAGAPPGPDKRHVKQLHLHMDHRLLLHLNVTRCFAYALLPVAALLHRTPLQLQGTLGPLYRHYSNSIP